MLINKCIRAREKKWENQAFLRSTMERELLDINLIIQENLKIKI